MMRKLLMAAASGAMLGSVPAHAQVGGGVVWCANCSEEVNDVLRWAQGVEQWAQQLATQVNTYTTFVTNTLSLPQRLFADLTSPIWQARALVNEAAMFGNNAQFMIANLGHPSGYGGSLADIPLALAQENNALSRSAQQLGLVHQQVNAISDACTQQFAAGDAGSAGAVGIKSTGQAGNTINATSGQCAEARAAMQAAGWNVVATAQLRAANRQALIDAASQQHLQSAIGAGCASLSAGGGSSWLCQQQNAPAAVAAPTS